MKGCVHSQRVRQSHEKENTGDEGTRSETNSGDGRTAGNAQDGDLKTMIVTSPLHQVQGDQTTRGAELFLCSTHIWPSCARLKLISLVPSKVYFKNDTELEILYIFLETNTTQCH